MRNGKERDELQHIGKHEPLAATIDCKFARIFHSLFSTFKDKIAQCALCCVFSVAHSCLALSF